MDWAVHSVNKLAKNPPGHWAVSDAHFNVCLVSSLLKYQADSAAWPVNAAHRELQGVTLCMRW